MGLEEKLVDTSLKIKVFIETGSDLTYNAYTNEDLPFGVFGEGETIQETKDDFIETFEELLNEYNQESNTNLKYSFEFKYDISSFLKEYGNIFSMSALERLSGINQKQLHHYASGLKNPRTAQRKKIENSLRELGKKLVLVELD